MNISIVMTITFNIIILSGFPKDGLVSFGPCGVRDIGFTAEPMTPVKPQIRDNPEADSADRGPPKKQ